MNYLLFIVCTLAVYRLSILFAIEAGPGDVFRKLRNAPPAKSSARKGLSCPLCLSIWWSAVVTGYCLYQHWLSWPVAPLYWLAFSAGAVCLHMRFTKEL